MSQKWKECENRAKEAAATRTEDPLENWVHPNREECPLCFLPFPFSASQTVYWPCCGQTICGGCNLLSQDTLKEKKKEYDEKCPFCRTEVGSFNSSTKSRLEQEFKLAARGRHDSINRIAGYYFYGEMGLRRDRPEALKWYKRAVEAGSELSAIKLAFLYWQGYRSNLRIRQDYDKSLEYFQKGVELGSVSAFITIGDIFMQRGEIEEAFLNYRKAVMCGMGNDDLFKTLRTAFKDGYITKDEYAFTLRKHQDACNEMKSDARDRYLKLKEEKGA